MKKWSHSLLWFIVLCAAFFSILEIFSHPSSSTTFLSRYSVLRIGLAAVPILFILFSVSNLIFIFFLPELYIRILSLPGKLSDKVSTWIGSTCFWITFLPGSLLIYYRFVISPNVQNLVPHWGTGLISLDAYFDRLWGVLAFSIFCMAILIFYLFQGFLEKPRKYTSIFITSGVVVVILTATIIQWITFFFELHIFEKIPGWYWPIIHKTEFIHHGIIFGVFFLILIFILYLAFRQPKKHFYCLLFISIIFLCMQYSIGMMEGRGLASLADRFFLSYHRVYMEEACNASISPLTAISQYEVLYPSMFLKTKPPGVLWLSFLVNQIANTPLFSNTLDYLTKYIFLSELIPRMTSVECQRSIVFVTLLFPLLSIGPIWGLFIFFKILINGKNYSEKAVISSSLFILTPNIVMLSLFMDQALYPTLFLFLNCFIFFSLQKKFIIACFLTGVAIYGALFLSFSMLPALAVPIIYFICVIWQENKKEMLWKNFKLTILPMSIGIFTSLLLFKLFLNYDIITRYQQMMDTRIEGDFYTRLGISSHDSPTLIDKVHQTWNAAVLNNIELAIAIGIPIFILFVVFGIRSCVQIINRDLDQNAPIFSSIFLSYLGLNIIRVVLGEVGRLWIFWVPVFLLLVVEGLFPLINRNKWILIGIICIQSITLFLTYQYQDYLMPQLLP